MRGLIVVVTAALLTLALTVLAIYATATSLSLSLPIPTLTPLLSIVLPPLTFFSILLYPRLRHALQTNLTPRISPAFVLSLLAVLDSALLSLAATDLRPAVQSCLLETRWNDAWRAKNERLVRGIQDALQCCGFRNTHHNAWPFPDSTHGVDACVVRYGREESCQVPLEAREQLVLGTAVAVAVWGLLVKAIFLALARERPEWIGLRPGAKARVQGRITGEEGGEAAAEEGVVGERYLDQLQEPEEDLLGGDTENREGVMGRGDWM